MIAALYVRPDSIYKGMAGVDAWDKERDARRYPGSSPVVAHPPCAQWSKLRRFAKEDRDERECAGYAVEQVRRFGGVLEHPEGSELWKEFKLPRPGKRDAHGFTLGIFQSEFGHPCRKATYLYIVGVAPADLPALPLDLAPVAQLVSRQHSGERDKTPPELARWLIELAGRAVL